MKTPSPWLGRLRQYAYVTVRPEASQVRPPIDLLLMLLCSLVLASCGDTEPGAPAVQPPGDAWWLVQDPEFHLVDGEVRDQASRERIGQVWLVEYSNGVQTVQLQAWDVGSEGASMARRSPEVGSATVETFDVTLRRHPGVPDDDIAPSVGAHWADGDLLIVLGGGALSDDEVQELLDSTHRVSQDEWAAAVAAIPVPPSAPGITPTTN